MSTDPGRQSPSTLEFLSAWFERLSSEGWTADVFLDRLADDVVWTATGTSPISGVYRGKDAYVTGVYKRLAERLAVWPTPIVERILAQDDWGVVQFGSTGGRGHNGTDYTMRYCWAMRRHGDKIVEVVGYYDTATVEALFRDQPVSS